MDKAGFVFTVILAFHSMMRWLVLISLSVAVFRAFCGWRTKRKFSWSDRLVNSCTVFIVHIQLILGLTLYYSSPIVNHFLSHFTEAVHQRELRFFGMEHSLMMVLGIVIITIGNYKSKRRTTNGEKHKTAAFWFLAGLLFILSSVPWAFSPLVARPWIRPF